MRVHVRHEREVGAVAGLEEDGHEGDQAEDLGGRVVRVDAADDDEQGARDAPAQHDPELLAPQVVARRLEDQVADDAAEGPRDKVEEAEHGGPVGRARLAQAGEVLEVVGAQDRVDGQLAAEGAEVGRHVEGRLQAEEHPDALGERRLGHDLALGCRAHLLLRHGRLVVPVGPVLPLVVVVVGHCSAVLLLLLADRKAGGAVLVRDDTRHVDHAALDAASGGIRRLGAVGGSRDAVRVEVDVGLEVPLGPLAGRGVGAEGDHAEGGGDDDDQGHDKGDAPGLAVGIPAAFERVEDGRHDEVGNAAAGVAPAAGERVGRAHDVLVEEARRPHHAGDKGAAEDADEEAADVETGGIMDQRREA